MYALVTDFMSYLKSTRWFQDRIYGPPRNSVMFQYSPQYRVLSQNYFFHFSERFFDSDVWG